MKVMIAKVFLLPAVCRMMSARAFVWNTVLRELAKQLKQVMFLGGLLSNTDISF